MEHAFSRKGVSPHCRRMGDGALRAVEANGVADLPVGVGAMFARGLGEEQPDRCDTGRLPLQGDSAEAGRDDEHAELERRFLGVASGDPSRNVSGQVSLSTLRATGMWLRGLRASDSECGEVCARGVRNPHLFPTPEMDLL